MAVEELLEWLDKRIAELEGELSKLRSIREHLQRISGLAEQAERGAEFTEEDLEALPWRQYPSGSGEWVFEDQAPRALVERLEREGQVQIGGYVYSLREGSRGKRFVSRRQAGQRARGQRSRGPQLSPEDLVRLRR